MFNLAGEECSADKKAKESRIPLLSLFNYGNSSEKTIYVIGCTFAFLSGALGTIHAVILAKLIEALNPYIAVDDDGDFDSMQNITDISYLLAFVLAMLICSFMQAHLMKKAVVRLVRSLSTQCFNSLLTQETAYFELSDP